MFTKPMPTFLENLDDLGNIDDEMTSLFEFTAREDKEELLSHDPFNKQIKKDNGGYFYLKNDKKYPFIIFSDQEKLQEYDKKILLNKEERRKEEIFRTLKFVGSSDKINIHLLIGHSSLKSLKLYSLIVYCENGQEMVIDYANNLIMEKKDYLELFNYKTIDKINKSELYIIYYIVSNIENYQHIYEYLIFTKEILNDKNLQESFPFLNKKYDSIGYNLNNFYLRGNKSDSVFFENEDYKNVPYARARKEIDNFTRERQNCERIYYEDGNYVYKENETDVFTFKLLSDIIDDQHVKDELCSSKRYRKCHENVYIIANMIPIEDRDTTYFVAGKIAANEVDYFFHSWIYDEKKNLVYDFNHNLIMNKEDYDRLYQARIINKTSLIEMREVALLIKKFEVSFPCSDMNYFGQELKRDLLKNKFIL